MRSNPTGHINRSHINNAHELHAYKYNLFPLTDPTFFLLGDTFCIRRKGLQESRAQPTWKPLLGAQPGAGSGKRSAWGLQVSADRPTVEAMSNLDDGRVGGSDNIFILNSFSNL